MWILNTPQQSAARQIGFGVKDSKGREVGSLACVGRRLTQSGEKYAVTVYSTRNGSKFGAIPRSTYALTLGEAQSLADAKVATVQKRVQRDAAKTGGVYLTAGERGRSARVAEQRSADRVDGYDRDDLGESPDH